MSTVSILVLSVIWATSSAYVMYYHNKHYTLGFDMVIGAIILGPVLMFLVGRDVDEKKKYYGVMEQESNDRHRRWFDLHNIINREITPNWYRNIPPPPPITRIGPSRVERAMSERDEAIRSATERINKNKLKDFKFLSGNVKD